MKEEKKQKQKKKQQLCICIGLTKMPWKRENKSGETNFIYLNALILSPLSLAMRAVWVAGMMIYTRGTPVIRHTTSAYTSPFKLRKKEKKLRCKSHIFLLECAKLRFLEHFRRVGAIVCVIK